MYVLNELSFRNAGMSSECIHVCSNCYCFAKFKKSNVTHSDKLTALNVRGLQSYPSGMKSATNFFFFLIIIFVHLAIYVP